MPGHAEAEAVEEAVDEVFDRGRAEAEAVNRAEAADE